MDKGTDLNDKEVDKNLNENIDNSISLNNDRSEIEFLVIEKTGRLWPYHGKKKALSASTLTKILRDIEYEEIPEFILLRAAERGKNFHDAIQEFVEKGNHPDFVNLPEFKKLNNLERRIHETINFLKNNKKLNLGRFLGSEKLHYVFYKNDLLATYVDLEFHDYIIELKTSNIKSSKSPLALLIFEIQLLIQYLCTGKNVYLLWSTGEGIIFDEFQITPNALKILDMLMELLSNGENYSLQMRKAIVKEVLSNYSTPKKLI
ncbi:MAG: hypothetical protein mread185_000023 [Mycoplasmataceae bacterium]|nr:MAG: hypothetical protein mread185_000023 [Mycoplasmataceae bacterium]